MKKIIIATICAGALTSSLFAQGTLTLTSSAGKIKYTLDGTTLTSVPTGNPASISTYGQLNIAVYAATAGTTLTLGANSLPDFTNWKIQTSALVSKISPLAGAIASTIVTLDPAVGAAGSSVEAELVAWTGNYTSFSTAAASGALVGFSGSTLSTGALGWLQTTGTSSTAANLVTGASGFNGLVLAPVPEPTTMALAGLGAAALLVFRRRK